MLPRAQAVDDRDHVALGGVGERVHTGQGGDRCGETTVFWLATRLAPPATGRATPSTIIIPNTRGLFLLIAFGASLLVIYVFTVFGLGHCILYIQCI